MEQTGAKPGFRFFLGLRARHLFNAGKALLMQRWLLLMGAVLASPSIPFVAISLHLGQLAQSVLAGPGNLYDHMLMLLAAQTVFIAWSEGLRGLVRGGAFRPFLNTLPITPQTRLLVAGFLVAVLDLPLFIPFVVGGILTGSVSLLILPRYIMGMAVFAGLVLLLQAAVVERLFCLCMAIFLADYLLAAGCITQPFWSGALCQIGAAALGGVGFRLAGHAPGLVPFPVWLSCRWGAPKHVRPGHGDRLARFSPVLRLQLRSWIERGSRVRSALVVSFFLPVGLWRLLSVFAYDERSVPVMIVGMGLVAQFALVPFAALDTAHRRAAPFLSTLPLPRLFWTRRDLGLVLVAFTPSAILFVLPLCLHALISPSAPVVLLFSYGLLLSALQLCLCIDPRWRPIISVSLSVLWVSFILMKVTV
ncbi:hypothetical protein [Asaia prunellae]|uniref:hypothetical protein n=1 Tax=Asaia prunellae TaxID=610245 RepID=UPI000472A287|nr:hypothetical protein [Asaia prunellae]